MADDSLTIHVRFRPDGTVAEIGECPPGTTPHDWFNHLSRGAGDRYRTLSGGRALFRVERQCVDALKAVAGRAGAQA